MIVTGNRHCVVASAGSQINLHCVAYKGIYSEFQSKFHGSYLVYHMCVCTEDSLLR